MTSNATAGDETRVNTFTTGIQAHSSVIGLADGGWLVAWQSNGQDGDDGGIYQQRYDADGVVAGAEIHVSTHTTGAQEDANVTALADGGWVVTWASDGQDSDLSGIYQQRYDADGIASGVETLVNTYTTGYQWEPSTTALSDGGWVVTWSSDEVDGDRVGISQQRYDADGVAVGTETVVNSYTTFSQSEPSIAALSGGGWVVTWHSYKIGSGEDIYQQRYNEAGAAVGSETRVNSFTTSDQKFSSVTALADGGWVVAWESSNQDGGSRGIYQQRYDASGATDGVETQVNTYTTGLQYLPSITALGDGGWLVVWNSNDQDGNDGGVYQQRYDADGEASGSETLVNLYTTGEQYSTLVAALEDGSWVVTWFSDDQDGSSLGVYQRHYAPDRIGTSAAETLSGTSWSETLSGASGADTLKGFGGIDIVDGGKGRDRLFGGAAGDIFLFESGDSGKTNAKADTIFDMTHADQIDLHLIDARETPDNDQAFKFIGTKDFTGHEGELRYEKLKSDTYIYGDTDGDKRADFATHLDDAMKLKADDFAL
ncbi:calcium-binding protein [Rhizobium sp. LjRoot254]|uniref:calcium-binding protein n=1 Tax=Rhizobium sp. LjRoot254 TaxID=3342297 RepID=UPI003ECCA52F